MTFLNFNVELKIVDKLVLNCKDIYDVLVIDALY
jgi:hypothetical protein